METRITTEVRIFVLILNTFGRAEECEAVAISDDYDRLVNWYLSQFAEEPYREEGFYKTFKKDSYLEYNNPCDSIVLNQYNHYGQGIHDEWVSEDEYINIKNVYNFV